jgi:hypothetical protein
MRVGSVGSKQPRKDGSVLGVGVGAVGFVWVVVRRFGCVCRVWCVL